MSDTPETDKEILGYPIRSADPFGYVMVKASFAARLECERDEARLLAEHFRDSRNAAKGIPKGQTPLDWETKEKDLPPIDQESNVEAAYNAATGKRCPDCKQVYDGGPCFCEFSYG